MSIKNIVCIIRQLETFEPPTPGTLTQINVESQVQPMDEFLFNTPRSTLQALKEATTVNFFPSYLHTSFFQLILLLIVSIIVVNRKNCLLCLGLSKGF
jgi:hypothetical protein